MQDSTANAERDHRALGSRLRALAARLTKWYLSSTDFFWGFSDLVIRFYVAGYFLTSGIVKALDWDTAILLATQEYPVSWMAPAVAALLGMAIELVAAALLLIGLLTRPAAAAMAALTIVSQTVYTPTTTNLLITAILLWYVVGGAARFSIDHILVKRWKRRGSAKLRRAIDAAAWVREEIGPVLMAITRIWLGVTLLVYADVFEPSIAVRTWLPTTIFTGFPDWLAVICAALFLAGFAAGPVSYLLFALIGALMITGAHPNVTLFPFLYLSIYETKGAGVLSVDRAIRAWVNRSILKSDAPSDQAFGA